jgi:heme-degrading monooxygenase HmoA
MVVSLTLLRFSGIARVWMLTQMAFARPALCRTPGLRFWKLLGSGRGFGPWPDFSRYALLTVWPSLEDAHAFCDSSPMMQRFRRRADETWTLYMRPVRARGAWSGVNPFAADVAYVDGPLAILTRATIRWRALTRFWSHARATERALQDAPGLLFAIGIGEAPLIRQATFSLWRDEGAAHAYAHRTIAHAKVIRCTRTEGWYAEELFARFAPIRAEGTWNGSDLLSTIK